MTSMVQIASSIYDDEKAGQFEFMQLYYEFLLTELYKFNFYAETDLNEFNNTSNDFRVKINAILLNII